MIATALLFLACLSRSAAGQCQLANPSFELAGSSGSTFAGWTDTGSVSALAAMVSHGHVSARMFGPDADDGDVSGVLQLLDTSPGDRWAVATRVGHSSIDPLVGEASGIVRIQWYGAGSEQIGEETHVVVEPSTPTDVMHQIRFETSPAPPGTVTVLILLAKLKSPANDPGSVFFDHTQFRNLTPPTIDDIQWGDFPGGRTIEFADRLWRVKGPGVYGPGPSLFADSAEHIWVDAEDRLHMTIRRTGGAWYSTEVALVDPLLYGDYIFTTVGRLDIWAPNVVLGLYTWQYPMCWEADNPWNLHGEFDIEISRWASPDNDDVGQFVAQPWDYPGNIERFEIGFGGANQLTSFAFRLLPDRVEARCWYGGPHDESLGTPIRVWTYLGPHIPMPEQYRVHINLWQLSGPPSNGQDHEVIISDFQFVPSCADDELGRDWRCFAACLVGPDDAILTSCDEFDLDGDGDVDLADFVAYQVAYAEP